MASADDIKAELIELLELMREDRITQEQVDRIEAIVLADPAVMDVYLRYMAMTASLRHRLQGLPGLVESAVGFRRDEPGAGQVVVARKRAARWWGAGLAIAAAVALAAVFLFSRPDPIAPPQTLANLTQIVGDVRVITGQLESRAATDVPTIALRAGDTVKTLGAGSSVVLTYEDGTRLALVNDSSVTCVGDERKSVVLHHGILTAQVAPQAAGRPMLLTTPGAKVEVLGTQFALAAGPERTELNVTQGRVRLTRVSDGKTIEVAQGQGVVSNGEVTLIAHDSPGPRGAWEADFEKGVPKGWTGEAATTQLPPGSQGAIAAVRLPFDGEPIRGIVSREHWVEGLFAVHEDSHLHITLKMQKPDWLNVFMSTRGGDATNPTWALHIFNEIPYWPPKAGEWRTVTIPLAKFRRKRDGVFHKEPPVVGEVAYSISISSTEPDRGLVVDRMWVTRGGPGEVTAKVLPLSP